MSYDDAFTVEEVVISPVLRLNMYMYLSICVD